MIKSRAKYKYKRLNQRLDITPEVSEGFAPDAPQPRAPFFEPD
jgi:hypothetical protein